MDSDKNSKARLYERIHSQFVWRFPKAAKIIGHLVSSGQISAEQFIDFVLFYFDEAERIEQNRELLSPSFDVTQVQAVVNVILRDGQLSRREWYSFLIALYQFLGEAEQRELVRSATRQTPLLEQYTRTPARDTVWDRKKRAFFDYVFASDLNEAKRRFAVALRELGLVNDGIGLDDVFLGMLIRDMESMEIFAPELCPRWLRLRVLFPQTSGEGDLRILKEMGIKISDADDPSYLEDLNAFIARLYKLFNSQPQNGPK